jgi:hypothetical protein
LFLEINKKNGRDYERLVKPVKFSKISWNVWIFEKFEIKEILTNQLILKL